MEWLLSSEDVKHWVTQVSVHRTPSSTNTPKRVMSDLKEFLSDHNLYIGPATFTSGFISVVHKACCSNNIDLVKFVLKHHRGKFDINQLILYTPITSITIIKSDNRRETLVHAVVNNVYSESASIIKMLNLLVSHGASVNIPDSSSITPLLSAVNQYYPNKDIVNYLMKAGADIHYQDNKGRSVLMYAVSGTARAVKVIILLLLKAGADPTLTDERGYNVLHHAICDSNKCVDNLVVLLSAKIPPNTFSPTSQPHALFLADKRNYFVNSDDFLDEDSPQPHNNPKKITDVFTKHPLCPPRLKVDSILVNATFSLYWNIYINSPPTESIRACYNLMKEGLKLQAKLKLPPPIISDPIEEYGGLSEVISVEELNEKYSDLISTTTQVNLAYQCLIIRERCLGYGEFTVISSLFMYGGWMIVLDHFPEGLSLWLRGTQMLLSRFTEGIRSEQFELIRLIKNGYYCISRRIDKVINMLPMLHDLSTTFELIVCNLIECQQQSIEIFSTNNETNYLSGRDCLASFYNWKNLLRLLYNLLNTLDITSLCHQFIEKCPVFPIRSKLQINVLNIALSGYGKPFSDRFLSILLESGGDAFVNKVGVTGYRPLKLAQTKEATSLLLAHGAHLDAVSKPILFKRRTYNAVSTPVLFEQYVYHLPTYTHVSLNPHLDDYFSTPLPLTCLSAKCIVSESIPYRLIDLPRHIIKFIALHDIEDIDIGSVDNVLLRRLQLW